MESGFKKHNRTINFSKRMKYLLESVDRRDSKGLLNPEIKLQKRHIKTIIFPEEMNVFEK
jgi:hypothetical protein